MVKDFWAPLGPTECVVVQFERNLKSLKIATKAWEKRKKQQLEQDIISTEEALQSLYDPEKGGFSTLAEKEALLSLEKNRGELLQAREEEWRQKSRALWLHNRDENTKFFQAYAKGRKLANTIWGLKDQSGRQLSSFEDLARLGSPLQILIYCRQKGVLRCHPSDDIILPSFCRRGGKSRPNG